MADAGGEDNNQEVENVLVVPEFEEDAVALGPINANIFQGHEQPPANDRLQQARIFLADEDANRCLGFKDKLSQVQAYLKHIEDGNIPCDPQLFNTVKTMADTSADWHDRMEKNVGPHDPLCLDGPQIQPYSTRLMSVEVTLAIRETKVINGQQTSVRTDHPPFTITRTSDQTRFLEVMRTSARATLGDLTPEQKETNIFLIENRAYRTTKEKPVMIPLWTDPIKGIPDKGTAIGYQEPWYRIRPHTRSRPNPPPMGPDWRLHRLHPKLLELENWINTAREQYRYNLNLYGDGDQRARGDYSAEHLEAWLRVFPSPEMKQLEKNAHVYSEYRRLGRDVPQAEYNATQNDWDEYTTLQDQRMKDLSLKNTPNIEFHIEDRREKLESEEFEPTKIVLDSKTADRIVEVDELNEEVNKNLRALRTDPNNWLLVGRVLDVLGPADLTKFREIYDAWKELKRKHLPMFWDQIYSRWDAGQYEIDNATPERRRLWQPYVERMRRLWPGITAGNPELRGNNNVKLIPLKKGDVRTDPPQPPADSAINRPYIFYLPWEAPPATIPDDLAIRIYHIHLLLKEREERGGTLARDDMNQLIELLVPFMYTKLRQCYQQLQLPGGEARERQNFNIMFNAWLKSFELSGIRIRHKQSGSSQFLLERTLDTWGVEIPILQQTDPHFSYLHEDSVTKDDLERTQRQVNVFLREWPQVPGFQGGNVQVIPDATLHLTCNWVQRITYAGLKDLISDLQKFLQQHDGLTLGAAELARIRANQDAGPTLRRFMIRLRNYVEALCSGPGRRTVEEFMREFPKVTILDANDFVDTDIDVDNRPGTFYIVPDEDLDPFRRAWNELYPFDVVERQFGEEEDAEILRSETEMYNMDVPMLDLGTGPATQAVDYSMISGQPEREAPADTQLDFSPKAERRGIKRAAIELALNFFATNLEQRRPKDRFRRVLLPERWQPDPPEVVISLSLEDTKRPVELDSMHYTKLLRKYIQWKDYDFQIARDDVVTNLPGRLLPSSNFNGPFTIATMYECQEISASYLTNLTPTWRALINAQDLAPRPFLAGVLIRVERGLSYRPGVVDDLYEEVDGQEVTLMSRELAILRELTESSWNPYWKEYFDVSEGLYPEQPQLEGDETPELRDRREYALGFLRDLESDLRILPPHQIPPMWSPQQPPGPPPDVPADEEDLRTVVRYNPNEPSQNAMRLDLLIQNINLRRQADGLLAQWDIDVASLLFQTLHRAGRCHMAVAAENAGDSLISLVPIVGHPETKYLENREAAPNAYLVEYDARHSKYKTRYNESGEIGEPLIQPRKFPFIAHAAFRLGRAIATHTEELTFDHDHYERNMLIQEAEAAYQRVVARTEGRAVVPWDYHPAPRISRNPKQIDLTLIARDLHGIAPDLFEEVGLNPDTLVEPGIALQERIKYAATVIQMQILDELHNNWESRFPVNEHVWGFAGERLDAWRAGKVEGPREYFSMRRWPPCEQGLEGQLVIEASGPVVQSKDAPEKEARLKERREKLEKRRKLRRGIKTARHIKGQKPMFPFGETRYQQAYLSWRMARELEGVEEFYPRKKVVEGGGGVKGLLRKAWKVVGGGKDGDEGDGGDGPPGGGGRGRGTPTLVDRGRGRQAATGGARGVPRRGTRGRGTGRRGNDDDIPPGSGGRGGRGRGRRRRFRPPPDPYALPTLPKFWQPLSIPETVLKERITDAALKFQGLPSLPEAYGRVSTEKSLQPKTTQTQTQTPVQTTPPAFTGPRIEELNDDDQAQGGFVLDRWWEQLPNFITGATPQPAQEQQQEMDIDVVDEVREEIEQRSGTGWAQLGREQKILWLERVQGPYWERLNMNAKRGRSDVDVGGRGGSRTVRARTGRV